MMTPADRDREAPNVSADVPVVVPPRWALLQRELIDRMDAARRRFEALHCGSDGRLLFDGELDTRDGVDDFYEPFFNWPVLGMLGGSPGIVADAKRHWEGVTAQLAELGMLADEYERGYDWFHQGESLLFFFAICAADPGDPAFRERAVRFARQFLPSAPNGAYDEAHRMLRAPHVGSDGPRYGLEDVVTPYGDSEGMRPYGLALRDIPGIAAWEDLADPAKARLMAEQMNERLGVGDVPVSLASTSLFVNAWLYRHEPVFARWIADYVGAWRDRAEANNGLIPDNVGPDGAVGELHGGRWFGGHYGWTWPHGLHSVEAGALIGAMNDQFVNGGAGEALDLARVPLDAVQGHAVRRRFDPSAATLPGHWLARLTAEELERPVELVPYRVDERGWFDWMPMQLSFPVWLWWYSGESVDRDRLVALRDRSGYAWDHLAWFRSKEEAGHEDAWWAWLEGDFPDWPTQSLELALAQVARRSALLESVGHAPGSADIHWWQQLNPVVTEVLVQQIGGAPAPLYNGGLPMMRLRWWDCGSGDPGLPRDVRALVSRADGDAVDVELVNLSPESHDIEVQSGTYGEDLIESVRAQHCVRSAASTPWPGSVHGYPITPPPTEWVETAVGRSRLRITLPGNTSIRLELAIRRRARTPRHTSLTDHHDAKDVIE